MAAHKDFVKLLADIEIYVDGIATMQIQNLNHSPAIIAKCTGEAACCVAPAVGD